MKNNKIKNAVYDAINRVPAGHCAIQIRDNKRTGRSIEALRDTEYIFVNRSKNYEKLCIILAGYKQDVWDVVFGRLKAYLPNDVDVCIMTSGLKNNDLMALARDNDWSYLSTEANQLSVIQNIAIDHHPFAKWIYKIDEDMFLTKGFFEILMDTYEVAERDSLYCPAFVSPLVNVSCYGQLRLLEKCGLVDDFESRFDFEIKHTDGLNHHVWMLQNPDVSKYMWGEQNNILDIDRLTERFSAEKLSFSVCPYRFSIGAILFKREAWEAFGGFPVYDRIGLGDDEEHICHYAFFTGRAIVVSENCVVGHLGYGPQSKDMVEYFKQNRSVFEMKDME